MKIKTIKITAIIILLAVIIIIYFNFLYLDFFNVKGPIDTNTLKYISILLCFVLSLITGKDSINSLDIFLLRFGIFMTVIADLCLLMLDYTTLGVVVFCIVQIIYCVRYVPDKAHPTLINFLATFLVLAFLYSCLNIFIKDLNILLPISLFYFICLSTSLIRAIKTCKNKNLPDPNNRMVAIGMILFFLCDMNVALFNITKFVQNTPIIVQIQYNACSLIWLFYLPSQILLSLSGYKFKKT